MEPRTKKLIIVFVVLLLIAGGYYVYRYSLKKAAPPTKFSMTIGQPLPAGTTRAVPAAAPLSPLLPAPGQAVYAPVIRVVEKGKEVQYSSPDDFLARTSLSPAEQGEFATRLLGSASEAQETAKAKGDKEGMDRAAKYRAMAERLSSLISARLAGGPEKKAVEYSSLGKRDPFMSPFEVPKVYPEVSSNARPLERVPSESIKVEAIMWNQTGYRALVITPDGRGYTVRCGEVIGNKLGRIVRINKNAVYVTEKIKDILGDVETRNIVLKLRGNTNKEAE